ncbi:MAG: hypothetical protein ACOYK8_00565 [Alphaproteobacteria bacterium]
MSTLVITYQSLIAPIFNQAAYPDLQALEEAALQYPNDPFVTDFTDALHNAKISADAANALKITDPKQQQQAAESVLLKIGYKPEDVFLSPAVTPLVLGAVADDAGTIPTGNCAVGREANDGTMQVAGVTFQTQGGVCKLIDIYRLGLAVNNLQHNKQKFEVSFADPSIQKEMGNIQATHLILAAQKMAAPKDDALLTQFKAGDAVTPQHLQGLVDLFNREMPLLGGKISWTSASALEFTDLYVGNNGRGERTYNIENVAQILAAQQNVVLTGKETALDFVSTASRQKMHLLKAGFYNNVLTTIKNTPDLGNPAQPATWSIFSKLATQAGISAESISYVQPFTAITVFNDPLCNSFQPPSPPGRDRERPPRNGGGRGFNGGGGGFNGGGVVRHGYLVVAAAALMAMVVALTAEAVALMAMVVALTAEAVFCLFLHFLLYPPLILCCLLQRYYRLQRIFQILLPTPQSSQYQLEISGLVLFLLLEC